MFFALPPYPMILASSYERIFSLDDAYRAVHTPLFGRARPQLPSSTPPFPCDFWHSLGWARVRTPDHPTVTTSPLVLRLDRGKVVGQGGFHCTVSSTTPRIVPAWGGQSSPHDSAVQPDRIASVGITTRHLGSVGLPLKAKIRPLPIHFQVCSCERRGEGDR
jgi:hypothetical protein